MTSYNLSALLDESARNSPDRDALVMVPTRMTDDQWSSISARSSTR